ncbi:MAG TPA: alkaline phosphatase family protein, partial [Longimicrobiales bacterium]|nr:alkaline phosphatase family protein [Longimicrobiales bacterium]
VNTRWRAHLGHRTLPETTPRQAGRNLARIASGARLTFYAHYATDHAGHRGGMEGAVAALERVDGFLSGILDRLPDDTRLLVASDHGNVEDVTAQHTLNPSLAVVAGPGAAGGGAGLETIADVPGSVLEWLRGG